MTTIVHRQHTAGLRRRRGAALRCPPLACGCADSWPCRHYDGPLSERQVDAAADAARHLLSAGLTPVVDIEVQRLLWRRGGDGRRLVSELQELAAS